MALKNIIGGMLAQGMSSQSHRRLRTGAEHADRSGGVEQMLASFLGGGRGGSGLGTSGLGASPHGARGSGGQGLADMARDFLGKEQAGGMSGAKIGGLACVTGGTDTHVVLVDLRPKGVTGVAAEKALGRARITCNKNGIPFDPEKPTVTSGIRLGSPAGTTRGFGEDEFRRIGRLIVEVVDGLADNGEDGNGGVESSVAERVAELCRRFPIYQAR